MRFVEHDELEVVFRGCVRRFRYDMMGFTDRRSNRPNYQWGLLSEFGTGRGVATWELMRARRRYEKRVELLSKNLRDFFRMQDAPFRLDAKARGWTAQFTILPDE